MKIKDEKIFLNTNIFYKVQILSVKIPLKRQIKNQLSPKKIKQVLKYRFVDDFSNWTIQN